MKIWIVSSDPFYKEFEKIAEQWPQKHEVKITLISKYGYNFRSLFSFVKIFVEFRPDSIITDHGYFGFLFINLLKRILKINTKFNFYLRGNYWLEERIRNEKAC